MRWPAGFLALSLTGFLASPGWAQSQEPPLSPAEPAAPSAPAPAPAPAQIHPGLIEYGRDVFLPHMYQDTKASFTKRESLLGLAAGGFLTVAVSFQDRKIDDYWEAEEPIAGWSELGDQWGAGFIQPVIVAGMYGWSRHTHNQKLATNAEVMAEALILQGVTINLMKQVTGRERPDHSDDLSFPSGHTGNAFCFAAVMDHRYGHKWGVPLFALAAFTGLTRMEDRAHWASDVVAGATLGTVIGYAVSKNHDDYPYQKAWRRKNKTQVAILPLLPSPGDDRTGIMLSWPVK